MMIPLYNKVITRDDLISNDWPFPKDERSAKSENNFVLLTGGVIAIVIAIFVFSVNMNKKKRPQNQPLPAAKEKIFINYRREDSDGHSLALYNELSKWYGKKNIFKDFNNIEPGKDFKKEIDQALDDCSILLVIIGCRWLEILKQRSAITDQDDFVKIEIATALKKKGIYIIPVLINSTPKPAEKDLPDELKNLFALQYINIDQTKFDDDTARLVETIDEQLGIRRSNKISWRKLTKIAAAILFMIILVWTGVNLAIFKGPKEQIGKKNDSKIDTISSPKPVEKNYYADFIEKVKRGQSDAVRINILREMLDSFPDPLSASVAWPDKIYTISHSRLVLQEVKESFSHSRDKINAIIENISSLETLLALKCNAVFPDWLTINLDSNKFDKVKFKKEVPLPTGTSNRRLDENISESYLQFKKNAGKLKLLTSTQ